VSGLVELGLPAALVVGSAAAFLVAFVAAVAGFGGGVLALPVFTALFGLRVAVPLLTVTQLASNASRVWFNRTQLRWPTIGAFSLGGVPFAILGGLLFAVAPLAALQRALGVLLLVVVVWRRVRPHPAHRRGGRSSGSARPPVWARPCSARSAP
jgi:uncharacterized membrane protein YfcA